MNNSPFPATSLGASTQEPDLLCAMFDLGVIEERDLAMEKRRHEQLQGVSKPQSVLDVDLQLGTQIPAEKIARFK